MVTRVFASILLVMAVGCPPGDDPMSDGGVGTDGFVASGPARVELGTGQANFEPIGSTMELVAGPQGGWHLFVTCHLYNLNVEQMRLSYKTERDGAIISMPVEYLIAERRLVREGDHYLRAGDFVVFDITMPSDVIGDTVTVTVTAAPVDGDPVSDSKTVTVVDEVP